MLWIVGLVVLACLGILVLRGMKGPAHSLESLERPIKDLLKRGYDGGFLVIDISRSKYFIQLRKYINTPGDYGIELCFPNAKWSSQFFDKLIAFCIKEGIEYSIAKESANGSLEFLYIDFDKDSNRAHNYVKKILQEIFELDVNTKLFIRLENATLEDELIDR
jgi:hypothetical protein